MDDDTPLRKILHGRKLKGTKEILQNIQQGSPEETPHGLRRTKNKKRPYSKSFMDDIRQVGDIPSKRNASFANKTYAHVSTIDSTFESDNDYTVKGKKLRKSTRMSRVPDIEYSIQQDNTDGNNNFSGSFQDSVGSATPSLKRKSAVNQTYAEMDSLNSKSEMSLRNVSKKAQNRLRKSTRLSEIKTIEIPLSQDQNSDTDEGTDELISVTEGSRNSPKDAKSIRTISERSTSHETEGQSPRQKKDFRNVGDSASHRRKSAVNQTYAEMDSLDSTSEMTLRNVSKKAQNRLRKSTRLSQIKTIEIPLSQDQNSDSDEGTDELISVTEGSRNSSKGAEDIRTTSERSTSHETEGQSPKQKKDFRNVGDSPSHRGKSAVTQTYAEIDSLNSTSEMSLRNVSKKAQNRLRKSTRLSQIKTIEIPLSQDQNSDSDEGTDELISVTEGSRNSPKGAEGMRTTSERSTSHEPEGQSPRQKKDFRESFRRNVGDSASQRRKSAVNQTYAEMGSLNSTSEMSLRNVSNKANNRLRKSTNLSQIQTIQMPLSQDQNSDTDEGTDELISVTKGSRNSPKGAESIRTTSERSTSHETEGQSPSPKKDLGELFQANVGGSRSSKRKSWLNETYTEMASLDSTSETALQKQNASSTKAKNSLRKGIRLSEVANIEIPITQDENPVIDEESAEHSSTTEMSPNRSRSTKRSSSTPKKSTYDDPTEQSPSQNQVSKKDSLRNMVDAEVRKSLSDEADPSINSPNLTPTLALTSHSSKQENMLKKTASFLEMAGKEWHSTSKKSSPVKTGTDVSDQIARKSLPSYAVDSTDGEASRTSSKRRSAQADRIPSPMQHKKSFGNDSFNISEARMSEESRSSSPVIADVSVSKTPTTILPKSASGATVSQQKVSFRKELSDIPSTSTQQVPSFSTSPKKTSDKEVPSAKQKKQMSLVEFLKMLQNKKRTPPPTKVTAGSKPIPVAVKKIVGRPANKKTTSEDTKESVSFTYTKRLFSHYARHKCTKKAFKAVADTVATFFSNLSTDVDNILNNNKKQAVELKDLYAYMKRLELVDSPDVFYKEVRNFLPLEGWEELIPTKFSNGIIVPRGDVNLE